MAEREDRTGERDASDRPARQFIRSELVPEALADDARKRTSLRPARVALLATLAGMFVAIGALVSVLVSAGVEPAGPKLLLTGLAFSTGYFFVALANAVLFTEANVALPDVLLERPRRHKGVLRYWAISFVFNFAGAFAFGWLVYLAQNYPEHVTVRLEEIVGDKMQYMEQGGADQWGALVVSGVLANMLVGLGFWFAFMAQSVIGKFIPLALAVLVFEAANFQHSPANMGYFSLIMPGAGGPGWADAIWWNIVPAAIGNLLGGVLLVAIPFWYVFGLHERR